MAVFTRDGNYVVFRGPERHCPDAPRPGGGVLKRGPVLLVYVTPSHTQCFNPSRLQVLHSQTAAALRHVAAQMGSFRLRSLMGSRCQEN